MPEEPVPLRAVCLQAGSRATCKGLNYYLNRKDVTYLHMDEVENLHKGLYIQ